MPEIQSRDFEPDWVGAIIGHQNLLADDPCSRYGSSLLDGDARGFEEVKRTLDISNASWIVTRLVVGQLDSACSQTDSKFTHYVPRLLALLNEYRLVLDRGLSAILERYHQCEEPPANSALRDFAVTHWGNPWLSLNSGRWSRISQPTRQMVVDRLKLDFIRQFFSLLAEDSANDKRRLKFWERHHKSIDDMYFALGSHARNNQSRDFIGLRKKMAGRVLDLNAGGSPRNNAFIMRMGDYIAVEFGVSGNACFIFERRDLPFDLEQKAINGDRSALKHENHVERLLHIDKGMARWEQTFEQKLRGSINVRLDEAAARTSLSETKQHGARHGAAAANRRASYSRKELERFCMTRSLVLHDLSAQRGNLWVRADQSDASVNRQLSEWGFQYRPGKGWWREAP